MPDESNLTPFIPVTHEDAVQIAYAIEGRGKTAVKVVPQEFTEEQKAIVRSNIDAVSTDELDDASASVIERIDGVNDAITERIDDVNESISLVETEQASRNISKDEFVRVNADLYKAKANISAGDTLSSDNLDVCSRGALNSLQDSVKSIWDNMWSAIYPVGSIYMSVNQTSPATLFGGTWERLKDRFLMGAGDTYGAGTTGGSASASYTPAGTVGGHTLTTTEIPSHAHGLNNHTHSVGAHSHGLNSHTHSVGAHAHGLNSHVHSGPSHTHTGPSHTHSFRWKVKLGSVAMYNGERICGASESSGSQSGTVSEYNASPELTTGAGGTGATGAGGTGNTGGASGNTANSSAFTSGQASGSTANSTAFNTGGNTGNTGNAGGGGSHNHGFTGTAATISTVSPYLAVYMWKRTA